MQWPLVFSGDCSKPAQPKTSRSYVSEWVCRGIRPVIYPLGNNARFAGIPIGATSYERYGPDIGIGENL